MKLSLLALWLIAAAEDAPEAPLPRCGEISTPLEGVGGVGGHSELCRIGGAPTLGKCIALLERADSSCTALTFKLKSAQGGRCALHDRSQPDFESEERGKATYAVRWDGALDACEGNGTAPSPGGGDASLAQLRGGSLHAAGIFLLHPCGEVLARLLDA